MRPPIPRSSVSLEHMGSNRLEDNPTCHSADFTAKYVDDSVKAVAVDLTRCLERVDFETRPVTYHRRTGHQLKTDHNLMALARQNLLHFELIIHQTKMQLGQKECDGDIHSELFAQY